MNSSLKNRVLEYMIAKYKSTNSEAFSFTDIKENFPGYDDDTLSDAMYALERNGLVTVMPADNVAYSSALNIDKIKKMI